MSSEENTTEEIGIPEKNRVKRHYTMSARAVEQRRKAAQQPKPGMTGKRNNWKTGQYASTFLTRIKPCKSTCDKYPCNIVEEGATQPGGDCLDAEELLQIIHAVHDAIQDPTKGDSFKEIAAVNVANSIRILEMLQEDIMRDGTLVKTEKPTQFGNVIEYKLHPALLALPKLIADLNMTPDQFMITPKAQARKGTEDEANKTLADFLGGVGRQLQQARDQKKK